MRAALAILGLAILVGACQPPPGRLIQATLLHTSPDNPAGDLPLPVVLGDETNLVVEIESAESNASNPGAELAVQPDPADPDAIIAVWMGGACDNDAVLAFRHAPSGYSLHLEVHHQLVLGCTAVGIGRAVRIKTAAPLQVGQIAASGSG